MMNMSAYVYKTYMENRTYSLFFLELNVKVGRCSHLQLLSVEQKYITWNKAGLQWWKLPKVKERS